MLDLFLQPGFFAGLLSLSAFVIYNISIFRGYTKPSRVTWWVLTIIGTLILISYYQEGARSTIWVPLAYTIGPLFTAILSIKYGVGGWNRLDRFCILFVAISLLLWWLLKDPLLVLITNILIDFFGILPTIKKSYKEPKTESGVSWGLEFIASIINLFAINSWTFSIYVYPVYLALANGAIALGIITRTKK